MITIRQALAQGRDQLHSSPTPALDARLLLEHVLECDHAYLIAHDDQVLTPETAAVYEDLLNRAANFEPIPYLTGIAPFYDLDFQVTADVLIPRPETEMLVETAVRWAADQGPIRIVDVGTGSGCIAVTLAAHLPQARVEAVDVSAAALAVARANGQRLAPDRVGFIQGSQLSPVLAGIDLLVANLPYVTAEEWQSLPDGVRNFEPVLALHGGEDGLDLYRKLLPQAADRLAPDGLILLEIGWRQGNAVAALARDCFPEARIDVRQDFSGHDRLVVIQIGSKR